MQKAPASRGLARTIEIFAAQFLKGIASLGVVITGGGEICAAQFVQGIGVSTMSEPLRVLIVQTCSLGASTTCCS